MITPMMLIRQIFCSPSIEIDGKELCTIGNAIRDARCCVAYSSRRKVLRLYNTKPSICINLPVCVLTRRNTFR